MVFVYRGAGKKQAADADICQIKCKKFACAIQWCLSRSNYQQSKCVDEVRKWDVCCERARSSTSTSADVVASNSTSATAATAATQAAKPTT